MEILVKMICTSVKIQTEPRLNSQGGSSRQFFLCTPPSPIPRSARRNVDQLCVLGVSLASSTARKERSLFLPPLYLISLLFKYPSFFCIVHYCCMFASIEIYRSPLFQTPALTAIHFLLLGFWVSFFCVGSLLFSSVLLFYRELLCCILFCLCSARN